MVCAVESRIDKRPRKLSEDAQPECPCSRKFISPAAVLVVCALALSSCQQQHASSGDPSLGVAYAGPATLSLRKELSSRSAASVSVAHGEELQVLETRRRFVRVRTSGGAEGWTDANLLLSAQQMDGLRSLSERAAQLPSQGAATVLEALNVHTEPARLSPSYFQIAENGSVDVVGHSVTPRQAAPAAGLNIARANPAPRKAKAKAAKTALLIAAPAPPGPPANWEQMSHPRAKELPGSAVPASSSATIPTDDWSLVRTKDGRAGWVLSRMLFMSVPDDIAKYAEGHRVTAYLVLGDVKDGGEVKHNYLWTTVAPGNKCCEFDSFRVFVWSTKRHRYETAFVERNVAGFYPVELAQTSSGDDSSFSLRVQDKDGMLYKRTYAFTGYHVRMISREPVAPTPAVMEKPRVVDTAAAPAPAAPSVWALVTDRMKRLWRGTRE